MFGSLAVGLIIAFKKTISVPLMVLYAVLEGVLVGTISLFFEQMYPRSASDNSSLFAICFGHNCVGGVGNCLVLGDAIEQERG